MNDHSQHELDDELLSAYLDDELSTEERALVETRLATDPAARQTLEQLRSVSQSLRDLPTETLGHDLRESILLRATASRSVPVPSPQPPTPIPHLTIGRTRRGWVWASLAIAAAILIMVFQPGREQNGNLPNVAMDASKDESVALNRRLSEKNLEELAADNAASPPAGMPQSTVPALSSIEPSAPTPQNVAQGRAASPRAESLDRSTTDGRPNADTFATQAPAEMSELKSAAPAPAAPQSPSNTAHDGASQQLVVHVLTNRAAFESKAFDTLLRDNGVNFETSTRSFDASDTVAAREPASAAAGRLEPQIASPPADVADATAEGEADADDDDVEVVLVDAPSSTIFSCMDALNKDSANYLGVAVEDPSDSEEPAAVDSPQTKKITSDMTKFNRGSIPQQQDKSLHERFYYFQSGDGNELRFGGEQRVGGGYGGALGEYGGGQKEEARSLGTKTATDLARARRLQPQKLADRVHQGQSSSGPAAGFEPTIDATSQHEKVIKLKTPSQTNPERMQVLFVLRPDDTPPPSLKAKNQPE